MKLKINLLNKRTNTDLFHNGVVMTLDGEKTSFADLEKAMKSIKEECNAEANRNGLPLSACEIKIKFL